MIPQSHKEHIGTAFVEQTRNEFKMTLVPALFSWYLHSLVLSYRYQDTPKGCMTPQQQTAAETVPRTTNSCLVYSKSGSSRKLSSHIFSLFTKSLTRNITSLGRSGQYHREWTNLDVCTSTSSDRVILKEGLQVVYAYYFY